MISVAFILISYLIGSVSFAVVISKLAKLPDPHTYGSGNPGATNVLRTGNKSAALFTLLGDALKGVLAVWLTKTYASEFGLGIDTIAAAALAVFFGHLYPIFHHFRGGKGVATALGILLTLNIALGISTLGIWLAVFYFSRISSLAAVTSAALSPLLALYFFGLGPITSAVLIMALLLIWRHKTNLKKLRQGSEAHFGNKNA